MQGVVQQFSTSRLMKKPIQKYYTLNDEGIICVKMLTYFCFLLPTEHNAAHVSESGSLVETCPLF